MRISSVLLAAAVTVVPVIMTGWAVVSCDAGGSGLGPGGPNGNAGQAGAAGADGGELGSTDLPDAPLDEENACVGQSFPGYLPPLDVYILLDATGSMNGGEKNPEVWSHVKSAIKNLVANPLTEGISVGMTYLPVPPPKGFVIPGSCQGPNPLVKGTCDPALGTCDCPMVGLCGLTGGGFVCDHACTTDADCGLYGPCTPWNILAPTSGKRFCASGITPSISCDPLDYGEPVVPIAELPGNKTAITTAIDKKSADGDATPTQPALEGAVAYAKKWAKEHPDHLVHILFATDGEPNNCTFNSIPGAASVASKAFTEYPPIPTFVLGIGDLKNLDAIASAGGTGHTYIANGSTVASQLVDVFNEIRANGACQFLIPEPENGLALDYDRVNVWYTPLASKDKVAVPYVANAASCDPIEGGWYYDDPSKKSPTKVLLCPKTCDGVQLSEKGVEVQLGCKTINIVN